MFQLDAPVILPRNVGKFYQTVKLSAENLIYFMQIASENDATSFNIYCSGKCSHTFCATCTPDPRNKQSVSRVFGLNAVPFFGYYSI